MGLPELRAVVPSRSSVLQQLWAPVVDHAWFVAHLTPAIPDWQPMDPI